LLYFVAKITQEANEPSGDFDEKDNLVRWEKKGRPKATLLLF
jgi:hypothetical protein